MSLKQNMQVFVSFVNFVYDNGVGENMKMGHNVQVQKIYDPKEIQLLSKRSSCSKYRGAKAECTGRVKTRESNQFYPLQHIEAV